MSDTLPDCLIPSHPFAWHVPLTEGKRVATSEFARSPSVEERGHVGIVGSGRSATADY